MRKAEALTVDLEDSGVNRIAQSDFCPAANGRLDEAHRRIGERGNDPCHLESRRPETIDALVNELVPICGNRQLVPRIYSAAPPLDRARELDREERVPARRFPNAEERRPRPRRSRFGQARHSGLSPRRF